VIRMSEEALRRIEQKIDHVRELLELRLAQHDQDIAQINVRMGRLESKWESFRSKWDARLWAILGAVVLSILLGILEKVI